MKSVKFGEIDTSSFGNIGIIPFQEYLETKYPKTEIPPLIDREFLQDLNFADTHETTLLTVQGLMTEKFIPLIGVHKDQTTEHVPFMLNTETGKYALFKEIYQDLQEHLPFEIPSDNWENLSENTEAALDRNESAVRKQYIAEHSKKTIEPER